MDGENAHGSLVPTSDSLHMCCCSHLNVHIVEKRRAWTMRWVEYVSSETLATFWEQVKLKEDRVFENKQDMSQQSITAWNTKQPLAQPESRFLAKLIHGTSLEYVKGCCERQRNSLSSLSRTVQHRTDSPGETVVSSSLEVLQNKLDKQQWGIVYIIYLGQPWDRGRGRILVWPHEHVSTTVFLWYRAVISLCSYSCLSFSYYTPWCALSLCKVCVTGMFMLSGTFALHCNNGNYIQAGIFWTPKPSCNVNELF